MRLHKILPVNVGESINPRDPYIVIYFLAKGPYILINNSSDIEIPPSDQGPKESLIDNLYGAEIPPSNEVSKKVSIGNLNDVTHTT